MLDIVLVLLALSVLLLLVSLLEPVAQRLALPGTLVLALFGLALGLVVLVWGDLPDDGLPGDLARGLAQIGLSADAFLYLFLPPLLFPAGLGVDLRLLRDEIAAVLLLAVVAVVVCAAIVGFALSPLSSVGLVACLLLGAVVASTDPAAVIGVFRDIGAPRRLSTLVAGESLFNDAAAIVLFTLFAATLRGSAAGEMGDSVLTFLASFGGGLALGLVLGKAAGYAFAYLRSATAAATTVSVALAYLAFILGEVYLQFSGVVAVVTSALVVGVEAPTRLTSVSLEALRKAWQQLEFWANSLIFVLASMLVVQVLSEARWQDLGLLVVLIVAALAARVLVLYLLLPLLAWLRLARPVGSRFKAVIFWGGLRGAVTLVLALSLAGDERIAPEVRHFVAVLATSFVLFTLFVQAPTLKPLLRLLGLNKLSSQEQFLRDRVMVLSREAVQRQVRETGRAYGFPDALSDRVLPVEQSAPAPLDGSTLPLDVGLLALAQHERELYLQHLHDQTLSHRMAGILAAGADRLIDSVKDQGLAGYHAATQHILRFSFWQRVALFLQRRFGWSQPLAHALADRFEALVMTELVVRELIDYAEGPLSAVLGSDIAAELATALTRRQQQLEAALRAVETRYPAYAESLRLKYLGRAALRFESSAYDQHLAQSLISREVYADLQRDLKARWEEMNRRPTLDLGLDLADMVGRVPLFADLSRQRLLPLVEQLRPALAMPGERVIAKGTRGQRMYFIVSGEMAVQLIQGEVRLGRGDFFGEMALLSNAPRNADVVAVDLCHLLVLEARDFRRVLRSDDELRAKIEAVAESRRAA